MMDSLPEELVIEIMSRLPCSKTGSACKLVCKRWLALFSSPLFIKSFIERCFRKHSNLTSSHALILRPKFPKDHRHLLYHPKDPHSKTDFSFSESPFNQQPEQQFPAPGRVIAACNDLLLLYRREGGHQELFICNQQTKQWLMLPRPISFSANCIFVGGIACDPYRYKVILVFQGDLRSKGHTNKKNNELEGLLFSSETGKWDQVILVPPKPFSSLFESESIFHDGMLYLSSYRFGIIAFDPFSLSDYGNKDKSGVIRIECNFIAWPVDFIPTVDSLMALGICQGTLRISLCDCRGSSLCIWDLREHRTSKWQRQQSIVVRDFAVSDTHVLFYLAFTDRMISVKGFHPFNRDAIYLEIGRLIVLCDLKRRQLQKIIEIPKGFLGAVITTQVYWPMLQWWPTEVRYNPILSTT